MASSIDLGIAAVGDDGQEEAVADSTVDESSLTSDFTSEDDEASASSENLVLEVAAERDVSKGVQEIADEEIAACAAAEQEAYEAEQAARAEEEARAAEEAARAEEAAHIDALESVQADAYSNDAPALSDVDFSCGKEAFVDEWGARINAYLAGSPLAGYGDVFAEAAWNYGVDPRWSPAISNTESSKGLYCYRKYNAWGWMSGESWSSWEEAINAHVAGLASGYGFTISLAAAQKYCPPNYENWYNNTLNEMAKI